MKNLLKENIDTLEHMAVSLLLVFLSFFVVGDAYYGVVAAIAYFFGREHAAAVWYRRTVQKMQDVESHAKSDLYCLQIWTWRLDNQIDFYASFVAIPLAYYLMM